MKEFNKLCKDFENMKKIEYRSYLSVKSAELIPLFNTIEIDGKTGIEIFYSFILGAIVSDGRFDFDEYLLILPILNRLVGKIVSFKEASEVFTILKTNRQELLKTIERMIDLLGQISDNLKKDVIIICMMVCAVDGKINRKEKRWIMQLIK